jgi:pimeloyl-ACP methyl ester carboxylesterase
MLMINLAKAENPLGESIMNIEDLSVYIKSFKKSGFTGAISWYRNLDRNWHLMVNIKPRIEQPTLMIYGEKDIIPQSPTLNEFAPNLSVVSLDCGHHIQQELPEETNGVVLSWLVNQSKNIT